MLRAGYYKELTQWSKGEYLAANNNEDDLARIAAHAPFRPDDHGNNCSAATRLAPAASLKAVGTIETTGDRDTFAFAAPVGTVSVALALAPGPSGASNLDAQVALYNAACTLLAVVNPPTTLAIAATTLSIRTAGTYYLQVSGAGLGSPTATGYSSYASLGAYTATITVKPAATTSKTAVRTTSSTTAAPRSTTTALPRTVSILSAL